MGRRKQVVPKKSEHEDDESGAEDDTQQQSDQQQQHLGGVSQEKEGEEADNPDGGNYDKSENEAASDLCQKSSPKEPAVVSDVKPPSHLPVDEVSTTGKAKGIISPASFATASIASAVTATTFEPSSAPKCTSASAVRPILSDVSAMMASSPPTSAAAMMGIPGLDLLKNSGASVSSPFLMPAQLLALNPGLYAAQLAQLQAAQLLLAKQQATTALIEDPSKHQDEMESRKRSSEKECVGNDKDEPSAKYPRLFEKDDDISNARGAESPLDLSGSKSPTNENVLAAASEDVRPDLMSGLSPFSALLPPHLLSLLSQIKTASSSTPPVLPLTSLLNSQSPLSAGNSASDYSALLTSLSAAASASKPADSPQGRTNPWQAQWMNKAASDGGVIGDVFKCVWCHESYQTLEALTAHMKEAKHQTLPYPLMNPTGVPPMRSAAPPQVSPSSPMGGSPLRGPNPVRSALANSSRPDSPKTSNSTSARDILKEQLPLPRKLVRGQDVWIGKADEQTRDILKCMGCGQSFRSLDLLTKHMQETQHYKKVISHDQLNAWKYSDTGSGKNQPSQPAPGKNHVNSVLSCKVCGKPFGTLKDLSDHMVKANHYGNPGDIMKGMAMFRPGHPGLPGPSSPSQGNMNAQSSLAKERKKALPVKKLLELERARQEVAASALGSKIGLSPNTRDVIENGKLFCERCEEKIPIETFILHIQQCIGKPAALNRLFPTTQLNATLASPKLSVAGSNPAEPGEKLVGHAKDTDKDNAGNASILGSLEQLVKGNFNSASRGSSLPPTSSPLPLLSSSPVGQPNMRFGGNLPSFMPGPGTSSPQSSVPSPGTSSLSSSKPTSPVPATVGAVQVPTTAALQVSLPKSSPANSVSEEKKDDQADNDDNVKNETGKDEGNKIMDNSESNQIDGSAVTPPSLFNGTPPPLFQNEAGSTGVNGSVAAKNGEYGSRSRNSSCSRSMSPCSQSVVSQETSSPPPNQKLDTKNNQAVKIIDEKVLKSPDIIDVSKKSSFVNENPKNSNPLAALQMLCDTQKKSPKVAKPSAPTTGRHNTFVSSSNIPSSISSSLSLSTAAGLSDPAAVLAFSWACSQAAAAAGSLTDDIALDSGSSAIKCPFCDTSFTSKGSYRHHLSKVHFSESSKMPPLTNSTGARRDGSDVLLATMEANGGPAISPLLLGAAGNGNVDGGAMTALRLLGANAGPAGPPQQNNPNKNETESLQSKYQKYAQLARQLSCNQK